MLRALFIVVVLLLGISCTRTKSVRPVIRIDGSSTVFPITEAMSEEFQTASRGKVRVTVGISGTGGGFKKFCRGEIDVQNASRPISLNEMKTCGDKGIRFLEIPIAFDATAVVVNLKNKWLNSMTVSELKKLWEPAAQSQVMMWQNVHSEWPSEKIKLFGAGADSGTFDYFTEAIVGKAKSSRGDYTASEDDNTLVTGVSGDKNAIGYLPLAYYEENRDKLKALAIVNDVEGSSNAVLPSSESVKDGSYRPLSRPVFIYVRADSLDKPEVMEFVKFYIQSAHRYVPEVKYVALTDELYKLAMRRVDKRMWGSVFKGHAQMGANLEKLFAGAGEL